MSIIVDTRGSYGPFIPYVEKADWKGYPFKTACLWFQWKSYEMNAAECLMLHSDEWDASGLPCWKMELMILGFKNVSSIFFCFDFIMFFLNYKLCRQQNENSRFHFHNYVRNFKFMLISIYFDKILCRRQVRLFIS